MLKKLILNNQNIPVPIPVTNLEDALTWVDQSLLKTNEMITRIVLDDKLIGDDYEAGQAFVEIKLNDSTRLEIQVDSPLDLAVQTLEAVRNLTSVISKGSKPLAVECWETVPVNTPPSLGSVQADLDLILELSNHFLELVNKEVDYSVFSYLIEKYGHIINNLKRRSDARDWKEAARLLLNFLDPILEEIGEESASLQGSIYSYISESVMK